MNNGKKLPTYRFPKSTRYLFTHNQIMKLFSFLFFLLSGFCAFRKPIDKGDPVFIRARETVTDTQTFIDTETKNPTFYHRNTDSLFVDPESFGARGDGVHDDWQAIQNAIDFVVANEAKIKTVVFKSARYKSSKPILIYSWNGKNYGQVTIDLIGQSSFFQGSGSGTVIDFNGNTSDFGIGIQVGKGCRIIGLELVGGFKPPVLTGFDFFNCSFSNFTDHVSRDQGYSPYAGIVIDPFGYSVPSDGGYPGYTSFYRGNSSGGSTGIEITDCFVSNFVVGLITSPNGQTQNAELLYVEKMQFENCKVCIVGCQAQEKLNVVKHVACWGGTHTFFLSGMGVGGYGANTPGNWYIEGVNIAGAVVRLFAIGSGGYFPVYFKNVYTESLGSIGIATGGQPLTCEDCSLDLSYQQSSAIMDWQFTGTMHFKDCSIRMYGSNYPVTLNGGVYDNCIFETVPFAINASFHNCSQGIGVTDDQVYPQNGLVSAYGNTNFYQYWAEVTTHRYIESKHGELITGLWELNNPSYTLSFNNSRVATITVTEPNVYFVGGMLFQSGDNRSVTPLGIVTAIAGKTLTISYLCPSVKSGNLYSLTCMYPVYQLPLFMGDLTAGSNTISNVIISTNDMYPDLSQVVGKVIKSSGGITFGNYGDYTKILSINGSTMTFLGKVHRNYPGCIFKNYSHKSFVQKTVNSGEPLANEIYDKEDLIILLDKTYRVKKAGFYNAGSEKDAKFTSP
jgi:hypothetical protein